MEKTEQMQWIRVIIWISIVLLTIPLLAETQGSSRSIGATWVDNPPVIDGNLSDSVWQKAEIAASFFRANEGNIHPAQLNTEAKVLDDEKMLYIGVDCEEPNMKSLRARSNQTPDLLKNRSKERLMPLQIEDALSSLSFAHGVPLDLSPNGEWVAYTLKNPRRTEKPDDERHGFFTRSGVRIFEVGCEVWVTNTTSDESSCLIEGEGTSWGPVWSPDGSHLIFYSDRDGQAQLWVWEKAIDRLRQVSELTVRPYFSDEVVRWTPDGRKVLCKVLPEGMTLEDTLDLIVGPPKAANDDKKDLHSSTLVYRSPMASKQHNCVDCPQENMVKPDVTNVYLSDLALIDIFDGSVERVARRLKVMGYWLSPDGTRVAFTTMSKDSYNLVVVSLSDSCTRVVASDIQNEEKFSVSWSPDSSLLSFTSEGNCFIVPTGGGGAQILNTGSHPNFDDVYRAPLWDTSGQNLYLLASDTLWKISVTDGATNAVARIPDRRLIEAVSPGGGRFWSPDGGTSLFLITRDDETKRIGFCKVNLNTGQFSELMEADANFGSPAILKIDVACESQRVIYTRQDAQRCEDIWIAGMDFQNPKQLTHVNPSHDASAMGASRLINYRSLDGQELCGALLLPSGYDAGKRYPLIVWVYGGSRGGDMVNKFGLRDRGVNHLQLLATRGYAILFPDAPLQVGTPMSDLVKTVLPVVNRVVEMEIADPERLGVMGHSFGGYCVLALIAQTTRFKVAISSGGFGNWIGTYNQMRRDGSTYARWITERKLGGTPWQSPNRYIENSPVFYLDRVQTPLLLLHGELDNAVPSFLADEIFVGLRGLGKWVMYVKYEGENHAPAHWEYANQVDYWERIITVLGEFLKDS